MKTVAIITFLAISGHSVASDTRFYDWFEPSLAMSFHNDFEKEQRGDAVKHVKRISKKEAHESVKKTDKDNMTGGVNDKVSRRRWGFNLDDVLDGDFE